MQAGGTRRCRAGGAGRREVSDQLFGRGFLLPGGEEEIVRLVRPLQFSGEARVLVVGSGVTGPAQVMAARLGANVCGYERLASQLPGPAEQAALKPSILPWHPAADALPRASFHHALLLMPLATGAPEPLLAGIIDALRPAAQIVLLEYVATPLFDPTGDTARAWMERESRTDPPIAAEDLARVLARLNVHIRSAEDISPLHVRLAVFDWRRMISVMNGCPTPTGTRGRVILDEAESWTLRARLLDDGQLRLIRWHATLP